MVPVSGQDSLLTVVSRRFWKLHRTVRFCRPHPDRYYERTVSHRDRSDAIEAFVRLKAAMPSKAFRSQSRSRLNRALSADLPEFASSTRPHKSRLSARVSSQSHLRRPSDLCSLVP